MQKILMSLVVFFVLELAVIIEVGSSIGAVNTILVMFLMMVLGVFLIKLRFRQAMDGLRNGTVDTSVFCLPLAGFLFLFPGFISDLLGLLLLIPRIQTGCVRYYNKNRDDSEFFTFARKESDSFFHKGSTIDGTAEHVDSSDENRSIK